MILVGVTLRLCEADRKTSNASSAEIFCTQPRNGLSPHKATTQFGWVDAYGPAIMAAAQHNLCPDTLPGGRSRQRLALPHIMG
jgi:hypothetical protein